MESLTDSRSRWFRRDLDTASMATIRAAAATAAAPARMSPPFPREAMIGCTNDLLAAGAAAAA